MEIQNQHDVIDHGAWVGREEVRSDRVDLRIAQGLAVTLDYEPSSLLEGDSLPALWHWVYFTPDTRTNELGTDGHPKRGGFLPPVELPNRMWAGGRLNFIQPLKVGERIERVSRILRCERKRGRAGDLVFVTVEHSISGSSGVAIVEEQDIVYRNAAPTGGPLAGEVAPNVADYRVNINPDPLLLFRYSALTFNAHRIHYDYPYVTQVEGYPGLVVHGPLTATLLLDAFRNRHSDKHIKTFAFRAVGPLFDRHYFDVCGRITGPDSAELWTDEAGRLTMKATVTFE